MKTYVITLSRSFLSGHPRVGEPTGFRDKFLRKEKIHTIRGNYHLWSKRIREVCGGQAVLSIREWTGAPYRSPQAEIARLTYKDGVGIQLLKLDDYQGNGPQVYALNEALELEGEPVSAEDLARNDGLSLKDWRAWFKKVGKFESLAIIHFTQFRYYV